MSTYSWFNQRDPLTIYERIDIEDDLYSIRTHKAKANAAGSFEISLAPTQNWTAKITVGSWIAILASTSPIEFTETTFASRKSLKMIGRIDAVRVSSSTDQGTGARVTSFSITGQDWGGIFNQTLYIDQLAATTMGVNLLQWLNVFENKDIKTAMEDNVLVTTTSAVSTVVGMMGTILNYPIENTKMQLNPTTAITIPQDVKDFLGYLTPGTNIGDDVRIESGVLSDYDSYEDVDDSTTLISSQFMLGTHTWWEILSHFSNNILNELVTELSWPQPGETDLKLKSDATELPQLPPVTNTPVLTLYKRVRPFVVSKDNLLENISDATDSQYVSDLVSEFKNLATFDIDIDDVVAINAGTNWQNKVNFIEIMPAGTLGEIDGIQMAPTKLNAQISDLHAIQREGIRPMILSSSCYGPVPAIGDKGSIITSMTNWKYLLKDWYFNTHNTLDGTLSIVGQNDYIQIGANVRVPIEVIDQGGMAFSSPQQIKRVLTGRSFLLAHIEAVSHEISVKSGGSVTFATHINFVRGIIVDENNIPMKDVAAILTTDATMEDNLETSTFTEKFSNVNVISKNTKNSPGGQ